MTQPKILAGPGAQQRPQALPAPDAKAHPVQAHPPWWGVLLARLVAGDPDHVMSKSEMLAWRAGRGSGFRWGAFYGLALGIALSLTIGFAAVSSQGLAVQWAYERGRGQADGPNGPLVVPAPADAPRDDAGYTSNPYTGRRLPPPADAPAETPR